jgi:hypothetical protein
MTNKCTETKSRIKLSSTTLVHWILALASALKFEGLTQNNFNMDRHQLQIRNSYYQVSIGKLKWENMNDNHFNQINTQELYDKCSNI